MMTNKIRLNQGMANSAPQASPVERIKAELVLPADKNMPWGTVQEVTLEEIPTGTLAMDKNGWVDVEIAPKEILTVEFKA